MTIVDLLTRFAATCDTRYFFGIPSWDQYLDKRTESVGDQQVCEYSQKFIEEGGELNLTAFMQVGFGIFDILLRVAAIVAVGFVVYGGIRYVLSQGEPDKAKQALGTIINALIGLGIAVAATIIVSFVGNNIG